MKVSNILGLFNLGNKSNESGANSGEITVVDEEVKYERIVIIGPTIFQSSW